LGSTGWIHSNRTAWTVSGGKISTLGEEALGSVEDAIKIETKHHMMKEEKKVKKRGGGSPLNYHSSIMKKTTNQRKEPGARGEPLPLRK